MDINEIQSTIRATFEALAGPGYIVLIPGMFHQNFSDFPFFIASPADVWLGLDGPIDADRGHAIVNAYALAFFDRHLKGLAAPSLLDESAPRYPEVVFKRRRLSEIRRGFNVFQMQELRSLDRKELNCRISVTGKLPIFRLPSKISPCVSARGRKKIGHVSNWGSAGG